MEKTPDGKFQRLFIMPGVAEGTFTNCLPLVLLDGTFFLNAYCQVILLAIGWDGENQPYLITWAIVESENTGSWTWFIELLVAGCPSLNLLVRTYRGNEFKPTVMSDHDKGLLNAEKAAIPSASPAYCAWHLAENIKKKFGQKARHSFWKLVYVQSQGQWDAALAQFEEVAGKVR
jgi:hypothetical protein